jgi:hypothetical protein
VKSLKVTIQGISPLLMHAFPMQPVEAIEKKTMEEQAELCAYRDPETRRLIIPSVAIQRTLVNAATFSKGKGRSTLQKQVAACVTVSPDYLDLGVDTYVIDSRPVVNPMTKGRVMRHRPKLMKWEVTFSAEYDETLLTEVQMRRIVDDAGSRVGVLDFRPEKKGPFGRFMVTEWEHADWS